MSGLEQAIRNALERAERSNPEIRSRIYQSARNALDAGLRKQDVEDPEVIARQRQRLDSTIQAIEDEELERLRMIARFEKVAIERHDEHDLPAGEPETDAAAAAEVMPAERPLAKSEDESPVPPKSVTPPVEAARAEAPTIAPPSRDTAEESDDFLGGLSASRDDAAPSPLHEDEDPAWAEPSTPEGRKVSPQRRSLRRRAGSAMVSLFVYSVLVAVVAGGVWWVYATGMVDALMKGNGDFDLIPKELQAEDFDPEAKANPLDPLRKFSGEWIDIFRPGSTQEVSARARATIGKATDSDGPSVTLASGAPDQDGDILVEVPADILRDMVGRSSTIALTMRSLDDKPAQIYVQCEFAALGGCGRHRFTVTAEKTDNLIGVTFDRTLAPDDSGHLVINTDLTGEGRAIKLYGIRLLPGT